MRDGGPAFPPNAGWRDNDPNARGMSLRDWFAGQTIKGTAEIMLLRGDEAAKFAERAYEIADAMLATREEGASDA